MIVSSKVKRSPFAAVMAIIVGAAIVALLVLVRHDSSQATTADQQAISTSASQSRSAPLTPVTPLPPVTATALLSAPVPASCNHPAGTLVNGKLPGIPRLSGHMQLGWLDDPSSQSRRLALGDLNGDGSGDAAAVLDCTGGMGARPQIIAFYTAGPTLLGSVNLGTINLPGRTPGLGALVNKVSFSNGGIDVTWATQQTGDAAAIPTLAYSARLRWDGRSVVSSNLTATTEVGTTLQFLDDLRRGNTAAAAALAAPGVGAEAANQFRSHPDALTSIPTCHGLIDLTLPEGVKALVEPGAPTSFPNTYRVCLLPAAANGATHVVLGLKSTGFGRWQVAWTRVV